MVAHILQLHSLRLESASSSQMEFAHKINLVLLLFSAVAIQAATMVTNVAEGVLWANGDSGHCLFIKSDGSLWAFGNNDYGQLGDGTHNWFSSRPEEIVSNNVVEVAVGGYYSMFVKSDGSLWAMGQESDGALGDGGAAGPPTGFTNQPEQIVPNGVVAVACGGWHTLFLKSDGSLWAMGNDEYGQLGDEPIGSTNRPVQIVSSNVIAVACGLYHSLFLKSDGSLWAFGNNDYGQLGDGTFYDCYWPEQIVSNDVVAIACGYGHSLFLKSDGSLWTMGSINGGVGVGDGFSGSSLRPEQIVPAPQPVLAGGISYATNLQFNATCLFGGTFYLLAGTNLTQPLGQWLPIHTNFVMARGTNNFSATLTNAVSSGPRHFYILRSQ